MTATIRSIIPLAHSFDGAADHFDRSSAALWDRFGRRLVTRVHLDSGMHVLDAACGTGASAIPAAGRVGRDGWVTAVDISPRLLAIGRAKARAHGMRHLHFTTGDMRTPPVPFDSQDAVLCGFGLHLVPDMTEALLGLWRVLRPGGMLAFTAWGPGRFDPAHDLLLEALDREADLQRPEHHAWERLEHPADIAILCSTAGLPVPEIREERGSHPIAGGEDWWELVLGSEYRPWVDQLDRETHRRLVTSLDQRFREYGIGAVATNVHYVTLRKE